MDTFTVPPSSVRGRQDTLSNKESSCPFRPDAPVAIAEPMLDALSDADFPCVYVDYLDKVRAAAKSSPRQAATQALLLDVVIAEPITAESVRDTAWNLLSRLHEHDRRTGHSWPDGVPTNMDHLTAGKVLIFNVDADVAGNGLSAAPQVREAAENTQPPAAVGTLQIITAASGSATTVASTDLRVVREGQDVGQRVSEAFAAAENTQPPGDPDRDIVSLLTAASQAAPLSGLKGKAVRE